MGCLVRPAVAEVSADGMPEGRSPQEMLDFSGLAAFGEAPIPCVNANERRARLGFRGPGGRRGIY